MLITELAGGFEEDVWFDSCVLHYGELCDVKLSWIRVRERSYIPPCPMQIHNCFHSSMQYTPTYIQWEKEGGIFSERSEV